MAFQFSRDKAYQRQVVCCDVCGHFLSLHDMDEGNLYGDDYVTANYRDQQGIKEAFDRINSLPPEKSDNLGRAERVLAFAENYFAKDRFVQCKPTILDVGSGLCVFLYRMQQRGWTGTAIDVDPRQIEHARSIGVAAVQGSFTEIAEADSYDAVAFNKVLEHFRDPVAMLAHSRKFLEPGGFTYVELPDGEIAQHDGPSREEFFIDHHHVFSAASLAILASRADYVLHSFERLREPSGKYTLRGFLT